MTKNRRTTVHSFACADDASMLGRCLPQLLEITTISQRCKTAIVCADTELTYGHLHSQANRLARHFARRGIGPGQLVGVALDRSVDLIVVLLAILKSGAAYVPIDPSFPTERTEQMIQDAMPKLVVAGVEASNSLAKSGTTWCSIEEAQAAMKSDTRSDNLAVQVRPEDLACVIYTSGSTGKPKGVEITHESLCNFVLSMLREPGYDETDRLLAIATVSFDMAFYELIMPLTCGATVIIAQTHQQKDPVALLGLMKDHAVTAMVATPTTWQMLMDIGWGKTPRLKTIMSGGEVLSRRLAESLLDRSEGVWNGYGPTEATVCVCLWKVRRGQDVIIGNPVANVRLYILDSALSPVSPGCSGELYIGGDCLARGYRHNLELTKSKFVSDPFHGGLMYRTGDIARVLGPGRVIVVGRVDGQVKIRGNRVEVGDVESAMAAHGDISAAVVVSCEGRLAAYYTRTANREDYLMSRQVESTLFQDLLRKWLVSRLPAYMVPPFLIELESLPVTLNGKIDRKKLPKPEMGARLPSGMDRMTEMERKVWAIWSDALGHRQISLDDNFFEVGGDSARVVRVQAELAKLLGHPVSTVSIFEHYTIRKLAAYLVNNVNTKAIDTITRKEEVETGRHEAIAIVSMACRLPGDVNTPEDFWELLRSGTDAIMNVPKDRWDADALYNSDPDTPGKSYCRQGGFVSNIDSFDPSFFGISPREARKMSPEQLIMLETCWEAFERAGYTIQRLRGSQTGVYVGISSIPAYQRLDEAQGPTALDGYGGTGSAGSLTSGRISYIFGLEGPSLTIDTACSSSLVATHLACDALRRGECDMAIVGGVSLLLTAGLHIEFSRLRGMSPDGRCRSFAANTEGTGWAEGSAVVVLKRLSDAQRDGDEVHAILHGTAVNHGGRSSGLTAPSAVAQRRLMRTALASSRLQPSDIDYIEAHGTGTKLGDSIETTSLADVFEGSHSSTEPLWIGSVKSNIGHTQAAAGLAGLLKVVLAMQNGTLPQSLHVTNPTPAVSWLDAGMAVVQTQKPWLWKKDRPRRAGVSSFGLGGTNAHVVVADAPILSQTDQKQLLATVAMPKGLPLLLSAHNDVALVEQMKKFRSYLSERATKELRICDVAYSLATSRNHFDRRLAIVAGSLAELEDNLTDLLSRPATSLGYHGDEPRLAMLFTGQGGRFPGMGKGLALQYPVFRMAVEEVAGHFKDVLEKSLQEVMWAEADSEASSLLHRTDYAQPALFTLQVSLWRLWQSWGVTPEFVLGHSVGELAMAHVAGIMDLADACHLVAARSRLMHAMLQPGKMVVLDVGAPLLSAAVTALNLQGKVSVAAYNTPEQTVASGDIEAIEALCGYFCQRGRNPKKLAVSRAFHSHHIDAMLTDFQAVAETVHFSPPKLTVVSTLTGKLAATSQLEHATYWVQQARGIVRFSDGIRELSDLGANVFIELGPHPTLCGLGATCLDNDGAKSHTWLPSLVARKSDTFVAMDSLSQLHVCGMSIDWSSYFESFGCRRVKLPTFAFQRQRLQPSKTALHADLHATASAQFKVDWEPMDPSTLGRGTSTWGLLYPTGAQDTTVDELSVGHDLMTALQSSTGVRLLRVADLSEATSLDGVVCLWTRGTRDPWQASHIATEGLAQLQKAESMHFSPPLVWVTQQAVGTGVVPEALDGLGASPLWGLMRSARSEHPELRLRLIDLDSSPDTVASERFTSALMHSSEPECVIREGRVFVPRLLRLQDKTPAPGVGPLLRCGDGAVLVTGGLGDLGAHVARFLAGIHGIRDLVLTSRRGMETPNAGALVAELAALGASATVIASDVANLESVESIMKLFNEKRPLRGVIHIAGVADAGVLSTLTPARCAMVFRPKVAGAWNLHQLTKDMNLELFVMFSSISSVVGMPGLGIYAASNAFLDGLAHLRTAQGLPATSIAYGTWQGDGMAASHIRATRAHLSQFGLEPLTHGTGLSLLQQAVAGGRALTVGASLDLERLRGYFDDRGGVPTLFSSLLVDEGVYRNQKKPHARQLWTAAPADQRAGILLRMVQETIARALGLAHAEDVDVDRRLQEIGIDSLTAILVRNHLAVLTGLTLSANVVFLHQNVKALNNFLLSELQHTEGLGHPSSSAAGSSQSRDPGPRSTALSLMADPPSLNLAAIKRGCLEANLTFENAAYAITPPKSVLVTGCTGFVGAFIVHELLKRDIKVHCLVRAQGTIHARQRIVDTLIWYDLWDAAQFAPILNVVVGDITQPFLGLDEPLFNEIAETIDAICHSGALVDWMRPLDDYVGPNMVSTHEVLRLASRGRGKAVHFVSTIATVPWHVGWDLPEDQYEYYYATSKYTAERMVAAARWRGAKASVYRLPFVSASSVTGHFRLDRGDFLHNLITGSIEMGSFPLLAADMSIVLPVDYLCSSIVNVITREVSRIGQDFDFKNERAPSFVDFFKMMIAVGDSGELIPFIEWRQRALAYSAAYPTSSLARIAAVLDGCDETSVTAMFGTLPLGQHVFGGSDYAVPLLTSAFKSAILGIILYKLYQLRVNILAPDGTVTDVYELPVGIRSVSIVGNRFLINDKPFYFTGFGKHEDTPIRGKGFDPAYMIHDFNLMKWTGANSCRTCHYPYAEEFLEYADRHGIVVINETPAVGLNLAIVAGVFGWKPMPSFSPETCSDRTRAAHAQSIRELIARDKNHASVVLWTLSNEPASSEQGAREYMEPLVKLARELDPSRPICFTNMGHATFEKDLITDLFDVICLNRYYGWYTQTGDLTAAEDALERDLLGWEKKYGKPMVVTEYGADCIAGLHAVCDVPWSEEYQAQFLDMFHRVFDRVDSVVGEHVWSFADFQCTSTIFRVDGNKKGVFTRDRRPKASVQVLKTRWEERARRAQ